MTKPASQLSKITMQISIPRDQAEASITTMQRRMLMVPTVYFLDICSISHIKTYLATKNFKDNHHAESIQALQGLDLSYNKISYLAALMEKVSDQRSKFSVSEFVTEARRDWDAIGSFFEQASTLEPWNFVAEVATNLFGTHLEQSMPAYLAFLQFANDQGLHNKIAEGKRFKMAQVLCSKALELGIITSHPVVLVPIACVYGCEDAKRVMKFAGKPENFNPSNALGDIQTISRVTGMMTNFVQQAGANGGPFKNAKFITADSPLYNMLRYFTMQSVITTEMPDGAAREFKVSVDAPGLYPDLFGSDLKPKDEKNQKELDELYKLLGAEFPDEP
ncbi:hypothetical protein [Janthinobacterium sp. P210005]|uniref:hypothetical protein n=1 Tax=Janthinobacterium sp. P210005 TaxID=3112938 RepID=UPI002E25796B|nr:hypothetical protein [Janthinobacterium sp. P210005]